MNEDKKVELGAIFEDIKKIANLFVWQIKLFIRVLIE